VVLAVVDDDLHVLHRESAQRARRHARPHALLAARLELRRDGAAHDGPLEREALAALQRLDAQRDLGELTRAAGLLLVTVAGVAGAGDRLAVGDGGGARVDVDAVALL